MLPTRNRRTGRAGFTLVELLVVIGIIALLVSILLPALSSARRSANTVKCLASMRELGLAFHLYADGNKQMFPVCRQDYPDFNGVISNGRNEWWQDFIMPYLSKVGKTAGDASSSKDFGQARRSIMWGCPEWEGWPGKDAYTFTFGVSRFENGYTMNIYPTCEPDYPADGTKMPPSNQWQLRWAGVAEGHAYKITQWTHPAERMLLVDANLWLLSFEACDAQGDFSPQYATRTQNFLPGSSNIDRYRHGKVPPRVGNTFKLTGGRVGYNILYVDGHASTVHSYQDGYRAVRMRYP
jgi:prepilin-type N-terminal cleavage/methylation domain-containing protein/prepilin-type processing-associated H-X9-DG protein